MAINDTNAVRPVESMQNIIIAQEKKEQEKKQQKQNKNAKPAGQHPDSTENSPQNTTADNDRHLLDFKA